MKPLTTGLAALGALLAAGCRPLSERIEDPGAGWNGGFEQVRSGRPVNWSLYSPRTVPAGDFDIAIDETEAVEGERALAFHVRSCSPDGGRYSPGIFQERATEPGSELELEFRIRSLGCAWTATFGSVAASTAHRETVTSAEVPGEGWQHVQRRLRVPDGFHRVRFELSVRSPGDLWIDDVRLAPVTGASR